MSRESINRLLELLADQGPIMISMEQSLSPLASGERLAAVDAARIWPTGGAASSHYISLNTLIKCLTKLDQ